ncbi:MAG TPA: class I SAM-dependent methyltransferase [Pseudonocardiaceae bacterium]|nr:class I SAM-dependent methyltransferase [Pseudonocardiaceae bacterium]
MTGLLGAPRPRPFPDERPRHVVVVAACPADVVLGVSGLLQRWYDGGASIVVATSTDDAAMLGASLKAQGMPDIDVHRLDQSAAGPAALLRDADACLVPCPDDHTLGEIALAAAPVTAHRWSYRLATPDDIRRPDAFLHRLTERQQRRKADGVAELGSPVHTGPDDVEVFFRQPPTRTAPVSRFTELYDDDDPWGVATKWYERRKRAMVLAALPNQRYGTAVEPACGTGFLTRELAGRCDRVLASDPVPSAVRRCREHTADLSNVDVSIGTLPDLPPEPADLVVFSEILYYLGDDDLTASVAAAVELLRPGGQLIAVHWLPWAAEAPRDGAAAHRFLLAHTGLTPQVEHVDERFVLHVLGRR